MRLLAFFPAFLLSGLALENRFLPHFDLIYHGPLTNADKQVLSNALQLRRPKTSVSDCLSACLKAQFRCATVTIIFEWFDQSLCIMSKTKSITDKHVKSRLLSLHAHHHETMVFIRNDLGESPPALEPFSSWKDPTDWSDMIIPKYNLERSDKSAGAYLNALHRLLFLAKPVSINQPYDGLLSATMELMNGRSLPSDSVGFFLNTTLSHICSSNSPVNPCKYQQDGAFFLNIYEDHESDDVLKSLLYKHMEIITPTRKIWILLEHESTPVKEPWPSWLFTLTLPPSHYSDEIRYHSFGIELTEGEHNLIRGMIRAIIPDELAFTDIHYVDSPGVNGYGSEPSINAVLSIVNHALSYSYGWQYVQQLVGGYHYGYSSNVTFTDGIMYFGPTFRIFLKDYVVALLMLNHKAVYDGLARKKIALRRTMAFSDISIYNEDTD